MPIGRLSIRSRPGNRLHHLYRSNGDVWWVHYTLNWDGRTRRIRRSLDTKCVDEAVRRRDELFARIDRDGEPVPERRPPPTCLPMRIALRRPKRPWFARARPPTGMIESSGNTALSSAGSAVVSGVSRLYQCGQ